MLCESDLACVAQTVTILNSTSKNDHHFAVESLNSCPQHEHMEQQNVRDFKGDMLSDGLTQDDAACGKQN